MKKIILLLVGIFMATMCLMGTFSLYILLRYADFQQGKAVVTIIFLLIISGFGLLSIKCFRSVFHKDETEQNSETRNFPVTKTSVSPPSATDVVPTNEHSIEYIDFKNTIQRVDGKPISDEEVPFLVQVGYENVLERESTKLKRTLREDDLYINFMVNHSADIQQHVDKFEELCRKAYREKNIDMKIDLLRQTISEYEKAKKWFHRTKGGKIYFEEMYEHMFNRNNKDFSYIDSINEYLEDCLNERDYIRPTIIALISSNSGILQKNIYNQMPDVGKSEIQRIIRSMETEEIIKRSKKNNSYILELV